MKHKMEDIDKILSKECGFFYEGEYKVYGVPMQKDFKKAWELFLHHRRLQLISLQKEHLYYLPLIRNIFEKVKDIFRLECIKYSKDSEKIFGEYLEKVHEEDSPEIEDYIP